MERRLFITGSVGALIYIGADNIQNTSAQVTSPNRIETPSGASVSESNSVVIPILPYTIRGENLDSTSDIILTNQLVKTSDSSVIVEEKRSVNVETSSVVSVSTPRVDLKADGANFDKSGTNVKLRIKLDHSSISSGVSTGSDVFTIVQSSRDLSSILIIPNGERVSSYDGSYELARWEKGGSLAIENGDTLTLSKN